MRLKEIDTLPPKDKLKEEVIQKRKNTLRIFLIFKKSYMR